MVETDEVIDELLENNEMLEDILEERTEQLLEALQIAVDTQGELIGIYRDRLSQDNDDNYEDELKCPYEN